jgi:hypothetical protein
MHFPANAVSSTSCFLVKIKTSSRLQRCEHTQTNRACACIFGGQLLDKDSIHDIYTYMCRAASCVCSCRNLLSSSQRSLYHWWFQKVTMSSAITTKAAICKWSPESTVHVLGSRLDHDCTLLRARTSTLERDIVSCSRLHNWICTGSSLCWGGLMFRVQPEEILPRLTRDASMSWDYYLR